MLEFMYLNSIMILLIPRCEIILLCDKNIFKFHYDSINSLIKASQDASKK